MTIDVADAGVVEVYRTLVEVVTPRPIAWVTSIDPEGRVNLAPGPDQAAILREKRVAIEGRGGR
jgi:hypothetical protein